MLSAAATPMAIGRMETTLEAAFLVEEEVEFEGALVR
jgi:hypothetical protein